jgi:predicted DNA-binding transcriptional regulator AlpA
MTSGSLKAQNRTPIASVTSDDAGLSMISGPKLRRALDISPPTLWRWRRNKKMAFPKPTMINGRLYFFWVEVQAWVAKQHHATLIEASDKASVRK